MAKRTAKVVFVSALCGVSLLTSPVPAEENTLRQSRQPLVPVNTDDCDDAISSYNSALSDVADSLRRYSQCVQFSKGHDDCGIEFSRLRSAQDDFESAVSSYQMDCD